MAVRLQVTAEDAQRLALAAVIRRRAAMAEEHRTVAAVDRTEVAADTVDMGDRIALDLCPAQ